MKTLFCDIKTTGTDHFRNCIIELNCIMSECDGLDLKILGSLKLKMRPYEGSVMNMDAIELNGMENDDIFSFEDPALSFEKFNMFVRGFIERETGKSDRVTIVSFNSNFTMMFLRKWFSRNGNRDFSSLFWGNAIDVSSLATVYLMNARESMKYFTLGAVSTAMGFEVSPENVHDSLTNLKNVVKIYMKMLRDPEKARKFTDEELAELKESLDKPHLKPRKSSGYNSSGREITITEDMLKHE